MILTEKDIQMLNSSIQNKIDSASTNSNSSLPSNRSSPSPTTMMMSVASSTSSSNNSINNSTTVVSPHNQNHNNLDNNSDRCKDLDLKIEFDGTTVLCRVCGDKASGFHYGVHSCEGCKGFFRRSIQQKIQYRPCTKNQQCSILRINRNRCQYCRLKKCIAVGMSRDAVRFGRVPKREKAKILAAMQKMNAHSQEKTLSVLLEDENNLMQSIIKAHEETCDYTKEKVAPLLETARSRPIYAQCPQMTCPLNPLPPNSISDNGSTTNRLMEDFSERFSPAIHGVVEFAKRIPGFSMLVQEDQVTLLKAGVFEVLLVRLACMFDSQTNSMVCLNGLSLRRDSLHSASNARFLLDSMFEFAERLNSLRLTDQEIGLFCAVVVIAPDRPGLRNIDLVQKINKRLEEVLQKAIASNYNHHNFHNDSSPTLLFMELTKKIPDLRTLNALHSEKLLGKSFGVIESTTGATEANSCSNQCVETSLHPQNSITTTATIQTPNQASSQVQPDSQSESPDRWSSSSSSSLLMMGHLSPSNSVDDNRRSVSPNSHHDLWMDSKDGGTCSFGSPRSISSGVSSDDSSGLSRKGSISSAPKLAYINNFVRGLNNTSTPTASNTAATIVEPSSLNQDESSTAVYNQSQNNSGHLNHHNMHHYNKSSTRVDSPTDSGIESGKEHGSASTPTTSVCSSPQSAIEESNNRLPSTKDCLASDSENGGERQESIDDMPVLKRALQAPPLVNTNKLMDEAYRHHKKFRAARRDTEPHSPTTTTRLLIADHSSINNSTTNGIISSTPTGVITSHSSSTSSLASTHSTLLKTLEQPSRYMNEQQLKRTDLIHNIIMNTEAVNTPATTAPMMILKDSAISSIPPSAQYHHQYQSSSEQSHPQHLVYSGSMVPKVEHLPGLPQQQQVTVLYTPPPSGYHNHYPHHIQINNNANGYPFSSGTNNRIVSNSPSAHHQYQQSIYRTSPSPSYLMESQAQQSQSLLVIGSTAAAPAHSPRPSSSLSSYSNGQSPYSHLQRCLTATVAPPLASNGPIILQTASSGGLSTQSNELDCQPLNLSKKAPLSVLSTPSPPLSSSSSQSSSGIQSTATASSITSSMIKIEVDQNA